MLEHEYLCSYKRNYNTEERSLRDNFCEYETIPMFANSDSHSCDSAKAFVVMSLIKVVLRSIERRPIRS